MLEDDSENAKCSEQNAEHHGSDEEEFLEAALRTEILHAVGTAKSATNTSCRRLKKDCGDEECADKYLGGRQNARQK